MKVGLYQNGEIIGEYTTDENGFIVRDKNESQEDFSKRLEGISEEFRRLNRNPHQRAITLCLLVGIIYVFILCGNPVILRRSPSKEYMTGYFIVSIIITLAASE